MAMSTKAYIISGVASTLVVVVLVIWWLKFRKPTTDAPTNVDSPPPFDVTNPTLDPAVGAVETVDVDVPPIEVDPTVDVPINKGQLVRYLRLARTIGSDYININLLEAYAGTCTNPCFCIGGNIKRAWVCNGRWIAVAGVVSDPYNKDSDWRNLNDKNMETVAATQNRPFTYMELDFGVGQQTNRVRVCHRKEAMERSNGVTLYVMDENRCIIMQYLFTGLKPDSSQITEFRIDDAVAPDPPIPNSQTRTIRFLRMTRTLGSDHMSLQALEAYLGTHLGACLQKTSMHPVGQRYFANAGTVSHKFDDTEWFNLNDGNDTTFCHTNIAAHAYMQLDFGENGIKIDRVSITFMKEFIGRANGSTVYALDKVGSVVVQYTFDGMNADSPIVVNIDMKNAIIS